jgi:CRISPR system Cascade subunit CasB
MPENNQEKRSFIQRLESLKEDRGALAALRRGLGQPPGTVPDMFAYVIPYLPEHPSRDYEDACYLVASLFAFYPETAPEGNIGSHFARAVAFDPEHSEAIERRFTALLSAHSDDLPFYLRQAVSYLRSKEIPVNWDQLLKDLLHWNSTSRYIQRQWAKSFWGNNPRKSE